MTTGPGLYICQTKKCVLFWWKLLDLSQGQNLPSQDYPFIHVWVYNLYFLKVFFSELGYYYSLQLFFFIWKLVFQVGSPFFCLTQLWNKILEDILGVWFYYELRICTSSSSWNLYLFCASKRLIFWQSFLSFDFSVFFLLLQFIFHVHLLLWCLGWSCRLFPSLEVWLNMFNFL